MTRRSFLMFGIGILTFACGGCGGSPTSPTPSVPFITDNLASVDSVAIVPDTNTLYVGQTQVFSLAVELGPGIPPSGPLPLWSSTNPSVVTVDGSGTATGIAVGEATITVLARGKTATRQLEVVP